MKVTSRSASAKIMAAVEKSQPVNFHLERNGRTYVAPCAVKLVNRSDEDNITSTDLIVTSNITYEFGSSFLENWRSNLGNEENGIVISKELKRLVRPMFGLSIGKEHVEVIGIAELPDLAWDHLGAVGEDLHDADEAYDNGERHEKAPFGMIPVALAVDDVRDSSAALGTLGVNVEILDIASSSFWVYPAQAQQLRKGEKHELVWKTESLDDKEVYHFALRAYQVNYDGNFQPTDYVTFVKQSCSHSDVDIERYHTLRKSCLFGTTFENDGRLQGRIVFMLGWAKDGREHLMTSAPLDLDTDHEASTPRDSPNASDDSQHSRKLKDKQLRFDEVNGTIQISTSTRRLRN